MSRANGPAGSAGDQRREFCGLRKFDAAMQSLRQFPDSHASQPPESLAVEKKQGSRVASHNVCELSKIASNTGVRSPGDELMTWSTVVAAFWA